MRPAPARWLPVLLAGLVTVGVAPARAQDALADARRDFVARRDTCALVDALDGVPVRDPFTATDGQLALLACDRAVSPDAREETGYAALPQVVGALKRLDLEAATAAAQRVGPETAGGIGVWALALIEARRGHDAAAVARLLALPAPSTEVWERASFALAIFGAAVPEDDRLLLAAIGRAALLEAAAAGRPDRLVPLARSLAALDAELGGESLCLAMRALRRLGRLDRAETLVTGPEAALQPESRICLQMERAIHAWRSGRPEEARRLAAALAVRPPFTFLVEAMQRTTTPVRPVVGVPPMPAHVPDAAHEAVVLARFASALGLPATPEEVEAAALARGRAPADPGFAREYLVDRGCRVAFVAGSARPGSAALARGLPFLLYQICLRRDAFVDTPFLVLGRDASTGVWLVEGLDLSRPDALPAEAARKGRMLVAAPPGRPDALPEATDARELRAGRVLTAALDLAAQGDVAGAVQYLDAQAANTGGTVVFDLYLGRILHQRFREEEDRTSLLLAQEAVERTLLARPRLSFEHVARGQCLWSFRKSPSEEEEAIRCFERAQRLEPASAYLARIRYDLEKDRGRHRLAMEALELARHLDPLDTSSLYFRGHERALGGDVLGARADLRRALDRRPDALNIVRELAELEIDNRRPAAALDVIEAYVERVPDGEADEMLRALRGAAEGRLVLAADSVGALRPFRDSPLPETRRRVGFALAKQETPEAEAQLRELLEDPHHAVRVTALRLYMRPWLRARVEADERLGDRVVALLRDDENELVRGAAAGLLGLVTAPYAPEELAATLAGERADPRPYVRSEAAGALTRHDGALARATLVDALEDADREVRRAAIEALFRLAFTYHGYDPDAPASARAAAIALWRRWLAGD